MKNIAEQITEGLDRFYKAFQRKRVLKSLEEISATTNEADVASAMAVAALSNKLTDLEGNLFDSVSRLLYSTSAGSKRLSDDINNYRYVVIGTLDNNFRGINAPVSMPVCIFKQIPSVYCPMAGATVYSSCAYISDMQVSCGGTADFSKNPFVVYGIK